MKCGVVPLGGPMLQIGKNYYKPTSVNICYQTLPITNTIPNLYYTLTSHECDVKV